MSPGSPWMANLISGYRPLDAGAAVAGAAVAGAAVAGAAVAGAAVAGADVGAGFTVPQPTNMASTITALIAIA